MRSSVHLALGAAAALSLATAAVPANAATPHGASVVLGPEVGGYVLRGVNDSVDATFTVPRWSCGAQDEGVTTVVTSLGQGREIGGAGVEASCVDGHKSIRAAFMTPAGGVFPIDETVRGGDAIRVSIVISGEDLSITVRNLTRLWGVGTGQPDQGGDLTAAVVGDARLSVDGQELPIPAFRHHQVAGLELDGASPDPRRASKESLVGDDGAVLVRPSHLHDGATAFTLRSTV